ncbi:CtsR family transcriptional regulator [Sulfobacillus harzensis]|uniref:CtsR family transcriptional regulator n=1 Tax=Sulfobacillus harzensis TaxID=2729629 RepID=A0A7Y0L2M2_9FIRM|nr:CtsR family transcriptional regulator [Sulfobacillus harzensis]NMP22152.1 CtsR family transcriptional regulator [Sulfobacillus harzensis]
MASMADEIEAYLRALIQNSPDGAIVIQRTQIAERFDCVPSQISYVLMTRFTPDRGYVVEGRRGGGGNIRVRKLEAEQQELVALLHKVEAIDQARAFGLIVRVMEAGLISEREAGVMQSALKRDVLQIDLPERDRVRARLLRAMLTAAFGE